VTPLDDVRERLDLAAIVLDFDGTLSPIAATPHEALLLDGLAPVLASLVRRALVVAVVTGRSSTEVRDRLPIDGVRVVGSYGFEGLPPIAPDVIEEVERIPAGEPGVQVEVKASSVAVHVRGTPDPDAAGARVRAALERVAQRHGLALLEGKRVWELAPAGVGNKGHAVRSVVDEVSADAVLYAGDDVADLEAFAVLARMRKEGRTTCAVAVIGPEAPAELAGAADLAVDGPPGLLGLLRSISIG
jgi:trehalose 6-phosphate phosphatase